VGDVVGVSETEALHGGVPRDANTLTGLIALKKMKEMQLKLAK
jgi:hypothetical protein